MRDTSSGNGSKRLIAAGSPGNGAQEQSKLPPVSEMPLISQSTAAQQNEMAQPVPAHLSELGEGIKQNSAPAAPALEAPSEFYALPENDFFATTTEAVQQKRPEPDSFLTTSEEIASKPPGSEVFSFESAGPVASLPEARESITNKADKDQDESEEKKPDLSFMPESKSKLPHPSSDNDDEEREELDQEEEDYVAPARRSFSGSPPKATSVASRTLPKNREKGEEVNLDADEQQDQPVNNNDLNIFNMSIPRHAVIIAAGLVGFLLFLILAANLLSSIFGSQPGSNPQAISLSGKWRFAAQCGNTKCVGEMLFHQHGTQITGDGVDNIGGPFKFAGSIKDGQHIDLAKRSVRNGQLVGDPTSFHGEIQTDNNLPFISGDFRKDTMQGGKWRGRPVTYTGIWEAEMTQPMVEDTDGSSAPGRAVNFNKPVGAASLAQTFAQCAVGAIIFVIFVLWLMRTLFGPDGLRATWDKEKYIPSQFRGQNKKDIKELSQPLAPGSLPLGQREEWKFWNALTPWEPKYIALPPPLRAKNPHLLILGGGKKGKSRLMASMITHDIESNDRAVVLIDSDGGLAETVTRWIAAHPNSKTLAKRVIMIDPSYPGGTNTYNPLTMPADGNLQSAASSLVFGMKAIYTEAPNSQNAWSAQTADILANAALLLMVSGKTLTDLSTLLTDNDKRDEWLDAVEKRKKEKVEYQGIVDAWSRYKRVARSEQWLNWIEPILNRISPTLSDPRVRPILTKPDGGIDLREVITAKKILIVKIPKAQLHDHANLLGSLIVTGVKQAALSIATKDPTQQRTVALYLDEFDNFIEKETFDAITHETKKFQIGFIGAIKTLQHLPEDFRNQLIINVGTISVFALAKKDGDMLGPQMFRVDGRKKKHETLTNFINPINSSPQFELISDEEKFNIDRILGQAERTFFCYRVGTVAGLFHLKSQPFNDIPDSAVDEKLIAKMHTIKA